VINFWSYKPLPGYAVVSTEILPRSPFFLMSLRWSRSGWAVLRFRLITRATDLLSWKDLLVQKALELATLDP
jgi:hypothetical protein